MIYTHTPFTKRQNPLLSSPLNPPRHRIQLHLLRIPPLPHSPRNNRPPRHHRPARLGAHHRELAHVVRHIPVQQPLLHESRDGELDVLERGRGVAPHHAFIRPELSRPVGRRGEGRCFGVADGDGEEGRWWLGRRGRVAFHAAVEVRCCCEEVREVKEGGAPGVGVRGGRVGEEEDAAGEGAPEGGAEAVREEEERPLFKEPGFVRGERLLEEVEVALADGVPYGRVHGGQRRALGPREEGFRGEKTQEEVRGDEMREDEGAVGGEGGGRLEVGAREAVGRAEEVVVCEVEAAEVVEEGDALGGGVEGERGRVCGDVGEDLLRQVGFAALSLSV